ncbi:phosphate ABC transporter permease PstA [Agromyces seonyuensis]|uniref:Phosphate transport system permease protein PstA n=1 Tax=Agromyces seonyuensis TaxID=2662446 RepID=A0A6I4NUD3_9MICO|nr:phosphate ABC transporter permease PstA [Agromyces seonyuensis]MWB97701.1 phosphate ABC transporter permease PstA [Agromyces seonyuensis]
MTATETAQTSAPGSGTPGGTPKGGIPSALTAGHLKPRTPWLILVGSLALSAIVFGVLATGTGEYNWAGALIVGLIVYAFAVWLFSYLVEGRRRATDRLVTAIVTGAFLLAMAPLISVAYTVVSLGLNRFDLEFFTSSMRNVTGEGGGALHAIVGTLLMTGAAAIISIPIGLMTSIYLVEYGRGKLARGITFLVDVMTGIPSIVAGLFAYALFALFFGPGIRLGIAGAVALSILMIPVVVRSSEEMLRLVPNELREASYALGVPKWLTIVKVVLPTSIAGIVTGIMLSIARVIGETAPLLIAAGFTQSMNYNLFEGRMQSLPVYVYTQYANQGNPASAYLDRAWAAALTLILIVMLLNLAGRLIAKFFAPKFGR